MKYNYIFLLIFSAMVLSSWENRDVSSFIKNESQQGVSAKDSIIRVPILEVQDTSFFNILDKIAKFKDKKKDISQKEAELLSVVKIGYYGTDIYVETIPNISTVFYKGASIPKGVISVGGYDFFYYDPKEKAPSLVKVTSSFKCYEYKEDYIIGFVEFDTWNFKMTNHRIKLEEFYPREEIYKELFFEIYNK
jgi:hypothetical protein